MSAGDSPDWDALEAELDVLLGLPSGERAQRLAALALRDASTARTLQVWLDGITQAKARASAADPTPGFAAQDRLGPWRLLERIGSGGMGEIWRGDRADHAFEREVAIKVLHVDGAVSAEQLARERALLAMLQHVGIAQLLDGGTTHDGRPWLVMEWVDGETLDRWVDRVKPSLRQRVALVAQVADAVAYAHSRLVVHSDLKPRNIMVDRNSRPRLLDFGIARRLGSEPGSALRGETAMTPGYAAPEQVTGGPITTRTDVFGLGAVLFRMLTERAPHETVGEPLASVIARIAQQPLPAPSVVLGPAGSGIDADLDAIASTALAFDPEQRYATVELFAQDLRRWLEGRSVSARNPTRWERLRRSVLAHRLEYALVGAVLVALLGGALGMAWQTRLAQQQRDIARAERDAATREAQRNLVLRDFLVAMFSDPGAANTPTTPLEILRRSMSMIDRQTAEADGGSAQLSYALGDMLMRVRDLSNAEKLLQRAVSGEHGSLSPPDLAAGLCTLGSVKAMQGRYPAALASIEDGIRAARSGGLGLRQPLAFCLTQKGRRILELGDVDGAIAAAEAAVNAASGDGDPATLNTRAFAHSILGTALTAGDRPGDAVAQFESAMEILRRVQRGRSIDAAGTIEGLAYAAWRSGDVRRARVQFEAASALRREALGARADPAAVLLNVALIDVVGADLDQAERLADQVGSLLGSGATGTAAVELHLLRAQIAVQRKRPELMRQAMDAAQKLIPALPNPAPAWIRTHTIEGLALLQTDCPRAIGMLDEAVAAASRAGKTGRVWSLEPLLLRGRGHLLCGDVAKARVDLAAAERLASTILAPGHFAAAPIAHLRAELLEHDGERNRARAEVERVGQLMQAAFGPAHPAVSDCAQWLADHPPLTARADLATAR